MNQDSGNSFNVSQKMPKSSSGSKLPEKSKNNAGNDENGDYDYVVREQDRFMPIANVIRIMRRILPTHAKISDDAKETIQECVSEFISFVTSEANDRCQHEQRKTITAEDVLWSMGKLGFDDYIDPLTLYLHRYREFEGERGSMRVEPMMKRPQEMGPPMGGASFSGAFQMAHHQGMYGPLMPGYGPNMNPNQGPMPGFDPFAPYK